MTRFLLALFTVWSAGSVSGNPVVLIDNLDTSEVSVVGMTQGTNPRCLSDAHAGGFVESGTNLANSNVTFTFSPPVDGCYQVEEYHPGSHDACSQSLAKRVAVDIGYCQGQHARAFLDQSVAGGDWTSLGRFPFFRGHQGRITLSSADGGGAQCDDGSCIFVADAVRVRWLGATCEALPGTVMIDNLDRSEVSLNGMVQGTNPACMSDAYAGGYVESGTGLDNSSATFTFNPQFDGCYQVEEYHPGNSDACSQHLAKTVSVDIDYCMGQHARAFVDQSVGGGQWTTLGRFPFYREQEGRITLSGAGAQCDAARAGGTCIFVADAVRARYLGETCTDGGAPVPPEGPSLLVLGLALSGAGLGAGLVGVALCMRQRGLRSKRTPDVTKADTAHATAEIVVAESTKDAKDASLPADSDTKDDAASVSTDAPTSEGGDSRSCVSLHGAEDRQQCDI